MIRNFVYPFDQLEQQRVASRDSYFTFLDVDSMHCGIYTLLAGAKDDQRPHPEDEIYFVKTGIAKIQIDGVDYDVQPGDTIFVPAMTTHFFHSIQSELSMLVFFSRGPTGTTQS